MQGGRLRVPSTAPLTNISILPVRVGDEIVGSFGLCGAFLSETVVKSVAALFSVVLERVRAGERVAQEKRVSEKLLLNVSARPQSTAVTVLVKRCAGRLLQFAADRPSSPSVCMREWLPFLILLTLENQLHRQLQLPWIARERLTPLPEICRGWLNGGASQITGNGTSTEGYASDVAEASSNILGMVEDIRSPNRYFQVEALG